MSNRCRIKSKFNFLKERNQSALVVFLTAGDPNIQISEKIIRGLPKAGADIIEIGMPFSDPMADGPVIQRSYNRALKNGNYITKTLKLVRSFRKQDDITPIILIYFTVITNDEILQCINLTLVLRSNSIFSIKKGRYVLMCNVVVSTRFT